MRPEDFRNSRRLRLRKKQVEGRRRTHSTTGFCFVQNLSKESEKCRETESQRELLSRFTGACLALAAMTLALMPRAAQAEEEAPFKGAFTVQAELITTIGGCAPGDN